MTSPGRPTTTIKRDELALAGYGVTRAGEIWILPDDAPPVLVAMVDDVCERRGHDWVYEGDRA